MEHDAQDIKAKLDAELVNVRADMGIAFGEELFAEFRKCGWIKLEKFGPLGLDIFPMQLPAYAKTHYAHLTWDIPAKEFRVGKDA